MPKKNKIVLSDHDKATISRFVAAHCGTARISLHDAPWHQSHIWIIGRKDNIDCGQRLMLVPKAEAAEWSLAIQEYIHSLLEKDAALATMQRARAWNK